MLILPRSSLLILVSLLHFYTQMLMYFFLVLFSAKSLGWHWCSTSLIQRRWPPVGRPTNPLMTRKSSSLPRLGALFAAEPLMCCCSYFFLFLLIKVFISSPQVLLPLTDQTFKNHCLYFLSTPSKNLSSCGCASNKEKEMVTRYCDHVFADQCVFLYFHKALSCFLSFGCFFLTSSSVSFLLPFFSSLFCKLAALVRHRISLFGKVALVHMFVWLFVCNPFEYLH